MEGVATGVVVRINFQFRGFPLEVFLQGLLKICLVLILSVYAFLLPWFIGAESFSSIQKVLKTVING